MSVKRDYRIVTRNSLADLEAQVRFLERDRWEVNLKGKHLNIAEALMKTKKRIPIQVSMFRIQKPSETADG